MASCQMPSWKRSSMPTCASTQPYKEVCALPHHACLQPIYAIPLFCGWSHDSHISCSLVQVFHH